MAPLGSDTEPARHLTGYAYRALEGVAHRELLFAVETFYSGASATFSPFKASGPFPDFAFFMEPSASF